ncbi:hypothetical protein AcV5_001993 [Taiwanofungus camphoratus]|nr:hypothetical protein AcV5_001993 [Antrodia cinnamomea]
MQPRSPGSNTCTVRLGWHVQRDARIGFHRPLQAGSRDGLSTAPCGASRVRAKTECGVTFFWLCKTERMARARARGSADSSRCTVAAARRFLPKPDRDGGVGEHG